LDHGGPSTFFNKWTTTERQWNEPRPDLIELGPGEINA